LSAIINSNKKITQRCNTSCFGCVINLVPSVNWTEQILGNDLEMLQKCGGDWGKAKSKKRKFACEKEESGEELPL
jgi:hypothetical protein